jgi:type IV pilus assembly protein PilY1
MHTRLLTAALLLCASLQLALADDTDVYLNPAAPAGTEPLVMFALDYRSNLTSTVCNGTECDQLIAEGYLPPAGPYNFFQLLRAVLKKVLDPVSGVRIGFMLSHNDTCVGGTTSGPTASKCSNGGYILEGFSLMSAGSDDPGTFQTLGEDPNKVALYDKLDAIPDPQGNVSHTFQGKELYFELFRYLTGQEVYNGHLGYEDFGDTNKSTNLNSDFGDIAWDSSIESGGSYLSPLDNSTACSRIFVINLMFQVSSQEDDSDAAILAGKAAGGMGGINLAGKNNSFDTVIDYMNDADLADGTYGTVADHEGLQNVISYFIVDPTKINVTTNSYANAGGTGTALALSDDPGELIETLNNILKSILSVSTTFVAPSVPVNVFNRSQVVNEVFMALFEAEENGFPLWSGNLKKLRIGPNPITDDLELQDQNGINAIDIDGRIKREAVTFWTAPGTLPPPGDDEVAGADGRAIMRGGAGQQMPGFVGGSPGATNATLGARQLFTDDPSDLVDGLRPLDADASTASGAWPDLTAKWTAPAASYAAAPAAEQTRAVNALRFARGLQDDGVTVRDWLMGDPLHSRPQPINYGARGGGYDSSNPDIRILVGTNDGVMHLVRNTDSSGNEDGSESWGFVPGAVLPLLDRLRSNSAGTPVHPITADGSPSVLSVDVNGDGNLISADGDKAYAYFGLRRGGKHLYALDVSDPDAPKLLWTITKGAPGTDFAELGQTWSRPQVGYLRTGAGRIPVLVLGGGYDGDDDGDNLGDLGKDAKNRATSAGVTPSPGTDDDEGNAIFIINAEDGSLVWKAVKGAANDYVVARKAYEHSELHDSFAADVVAVDTTGSGELDRIYAADTGGVVWRIDLAGYVDHDANPLTAKVLVTDQPKAWSVSRLASVGRHVPGYTTIATDRRFFNAIDVAKSRDGLGPFDAVAIGSGDREDPNGKDVENWFYMIKDRRIASGSPPTTTIEHADLADLSDNCLQTASCVSPPDLGSGWRIRLDAAGEKGLAAALIIGGTTFFTTYEPAPPTGTCTLSEGRGRLYAVSLQDATAVFNFDTTNDVGGVVPERVDLLGSGGIPVEVVPLSRGHILVQGQETGENILDTGARTGFKTYWHEVYE